MKSGLRLIASKGVVGFNSLPASGDFCRLLITLANSLDPDQDRPNVRHVLDPNSLTF